MRVIGLSTAQRVISPWTGLISDHSKQPQLPKFAGWQRKTSGVRIRGAGWNQANNATYSIMSISTAWLL